MIQYVVLFLTGFGLCGPVSAATAFSCVSFPPSTSYVLDQLDSGDYDFTVIHHYGVEHAPLLNGITTGYTIKIVEDRFSYVKKMGQQFTIRFPKDTCKFNEDKLSCYLRGDVMLGNLKSNGAYLLAYRSTNITPFGEFKEIQVRFDYRIKGWAHEMSMEFSETDCTGMGP